MVKDKTLLEKLAALEHDQWVEWASTIWATENISEERKQRWQKAFIPYSELSEEVKEQDRIWARKVLEVINNT